jgi:DNA-binding response OmpR family regulator/signal recognition particle receptor subunit beta
MTVITMPPKILIVDDDPKWLRVVSLYLERQQDEVTKAATGQEAIERIAQDPPHLIIADIGMPGIDGYELCSRIRQDPTTRTIPFIFLTGHDDDTERIKARKVGSDDYLTKPCPFERLIHSVEAVMDRLEQARRISLEEIGPSGRLDDVDLLDLIQTLELEQRTGALVLSHGERTATLYFRSGVIVDAGIQSPKRQDPLFVLLGWKTGRFLFLPDAVPERMPITASVANLLLQDLRAIEQHEEQQESPRPEDLPWNDVDRPIQHILSALEETSRRLRVTDPKPAGPTVLRLLVVGVRRSGKSELIHGIVKDFSGSRWAAVGVEQPATKYVTDFGRVRTSQQTVLHVIAVRAEKRFWRVWEQCLPDAIGAVVLVNPQNPATKDHLRAFLKARAALMPDLPVHGIVPTIDDTDSMPISERAEMNEFLQGLDLKVSVGSLESETLRLEVLDQLLQKALAVADSD